MRLRATRVARGRRRSLDLLARARLGLAVALHPPEAGGHSAAGIGWQPDVARRDNRARVRLLARP